MSSSKISLVYSCYSTTDALAHLMGWGREAPSRLERTGRKKELERFVMNRLMKAILTNKVLKGPVTLLESENPDFFVIDGQTQLGVEITEAADQAEQAEWTRHAKEDRDVEAWVNGKTLRIGKFGRIGSLWTTKGGVVRPDNSINVDDPASFRELCRKAIAKKVNKSSINVTHLAIYPNTNLCAYKSADWISAALDGLGEGTDKFACIWLVRDHAVLELKSGLWLTTGAEDEEHIEVHEPLDHIFP